MPREEVQSWGSGGSYEGREVSSDSGEGSGVHDLPMLPTLVPNSLPSLKASPTF